MDAVRARVIATMVVLLGLATGTLVLARMAADARDRAVAITEADLARARAQADAAAAMAELERLQRELGNLRHVMDDAVARVVHVQTEIERARALLRLDELRRMEPSRRMYTCILPRVSIACRDNPLGRGCPE